MTIGEYGTDLLKTLFDSKTQNPITNNHQHYNINSDDEESQQQNSELKIHIKIIIIMHIYLFVRYVFETLQYSWQSKITSQY